MCLQLREDFLIVQEHLKPPIPERLELQVGNFLFEFFQDFLRQTDGMRLVLSSGAIFNCYFHRGHQRGSCPGGRLSPFTPPTYS